MKSHPIRSIFWTVFAVIMSACSHQEKKEIANNTDSISSTILTDTIISKDTFKLKDTVSATNPITPETKIPKLIEIKAIETDEIEAPDYRQDQSFNAVGDIPPNEGKHGEDEIFSVVEQIATYPGGTDAMMRYIREHITYPMLAKEQGIEGTVQARFVVNKDGKITQIKVAKSSGSNLLDEEAIRVLKTMPKWTPAVINGRSVNSYFTVPVTFRLD